MHFLVFDLKFRGGIFFKLPEDYSLIIPFSNANSFAIVPTYSKNQNRFEIFI
jgi:hypothetical protein